MTGAHVRVKIQEAGIPLAEIARRLGISQQNFRAWLKSPDFKIGKLQQVAQAIDRPISYFNIEPVFAKPQIPSTKLSVSLIMLMEKRVELERENAVLMYRVEHQSLSDLIFNFISL